MSKSVVSKRPFWLNLLVLISGNVQINLPFDIESASPVFALAVADPDEALYIDHILSAIRLQGFKQVVGVVADEAVGFAVWLARDGAGFAHEFKEPTGGLRLDEDIAVRVGDEEQIGGQRPFVGQVMGGQADAEGLQAHGGGRVAVEQFAHLGAEVGFVERWMVENGRVSRRWYPPPEQVVVLRHLVQP